MWLLLLIPLLGMTSVLFARTEKAVNLDDKLRFTQSNAEMTFRLPEPMIDYSSGSPASTRTSSSASARTVPPPPAAVTRAEYIRVIGDDEVITDELRNDAQRKNEMIIRERNVMTIQINKNNEIYVRNGLIKRVITIDELKDLAKRFIQNPDNDSRLPVIEDYDIDGYGTVQTTVKHVISLQYDRSSSAGVWSDVRYELMKAYNELRDEVCIGKFGKDYDQCTDSQQRFARGMYQMKISEAQPKVYGGAQGELIKKEVKSFAGNYVVKDDKVNKDLRIRVANSPVRLYVSTVMFDNENGQDRFRSETTPKQIRVEELDDYIDQAISDGMKIRKVRLSMQPDVPMGPIFDLKETLRYRMLLLLVMESYNNPALVSQNSQFVDEDVFNGKLPEMVQYIQDNISYPDEAKQDSNSNVLASFTIGKDGNVMNPEIIGSADPALDEEALKVLSQMPTWIPARNENGEEIEVKYTIPVSSSLPADLFLNIE